MPSLIDLITSGQTKPGDVDQINQQYRAQLGRSPDDQGGGFWLDAMQKGMSPAEMAQRFYQSQEAQKLASGTRGPILPTSQAQSDWKQRAQAATNGLNAMPFVLDPSKLTSDPLANKNLMYPALLQPGGASQVIAGGKNIGPDLSAQGMDASQVPQMSSVDDLVKYIAAKTGKSMDEAKTFLQGLIGTGQGAETSATNGMATAEQSAQQKAQDEAMNQMSRYNASVG